MQLLHTSARERTPYTGCGEEGTRLGMGIDRLERNRGGFDPPIQHHPYGYSTANRVPAVGRNKIDLVPLSQPPRPPTPPPPPLLLPGCSEALRLDSHVGESGKTLLARDAFIRRSGWEREAGGERTVEKVRLALMGMPWNGKVCSSPSPGVRVFVHVHLEVCFHFG